MDPALAIEVAASSRAEVVNSAISRGESDIQRFYKNSVIFLTGGSGFIGKQLTEKLLRTCSLTKIYLLIRPKKGKNIQQRMDDLIKEPVFDSLRKIKPNFASMIEPVPGDISDINLGIKDDVWRKVTQEVNVIFHAAATTRFDETIKVATFINVRGTREVLALGNACKNLKSYVHVSTAYSHATTKNVDKKVLEQFFAPPISPATLIQLAENVDQDRLGGITPALIKDWPNSYTFTKAVAEELIRENSAGLPICIVRPAIVTCSYSEPSPGWLDLSCVYGATGLLLGIGLGVLHTVHVKNKAVLGYIPCDMVNNAIIAAGREAATSQSRGGDETRIYNVSTTNRNPIMWQTIRDIIQEKGPTIPTPKLVYYPIFYETNYKLLYMALSLFFHIIPAYIADTVCLITRKQRRFVKISRKVNNMLNVLSFFLINQWTFVDSNLEKLFKNLSRDDQTIYNFDVTSIDIEEFVKLWCIGTRKYIVKDGLQGTNYAIKKQNILRVVNYFVMTIYIYGLWKLFCFIWFSLSLFCTCVANVLSFF